MRHTAFCGCRRVVTRLRVAPPSAVVARRIARCVHTASHRLLRLSPTVSQGVFTLRHTAFCGCRPPYRKVCSHCVTPPSAVVARHIARCVHTASHRLLRLSPAVSQGVFTPRHTAFCGCRPPYRKVCSHRVTPPSAVVARRIARCVHIASHRLLRLSPATSQGVFTPRHTAFCGCRRVAPCLRVAPPSAVVGVVSQPTPVLHL